MLTRKIKHNANSVFPHNVVAFTFEVDALSKLLYPLWTFLVPETAKKTQISIKNKNHVI